MPESDPWLVESEYVNRSQIGSFYVTFGVKRNRAFENVLMLI